MISRPGAVKPKRDTPPVRRPVRAASIRALGGVGRPPGGLSLLVRREDLTGPAVAVLGTAGEEEETELEEDEMIMNKCARHEKIERIRIKQEQ